MVNGIFDLIICLVFITGCIMMLHPFLRLIMYLSTVFSEFGCSPDSDPETGSCERNPGGWSDAMSELEAARIRQACINQNIIEDCRCRNYGFSLFR